MTSYDRVLAIVEFDQCHLRVRINKGLLVNAANAFNVSHVVGVLTAQIARMFGLYLPVSFLFFACPFQGP